MAINTNTCCSNDSGGGDKHYRFEQITPETTWSITHNLQKIPSVTVLDNTGNVVIGQVIHSNSNQLTLNFNAAFSGVAYMN